MRRISPGRSRLQLGEMQQQHVRQVRGSPTSSGCSPRTARTDGRRAPAIRRKYCADVGRRPLDRRADAAGRVVQRAGTRSRWRWRGGCTCSRPRRARRGRCRGIWRAGEKTSASTGRWVLRKRRWVCASTAGSFTSFGGTRRSSQGDISATSRSVCAVEEELGDDLLHPGGAGLGVGGDDDVVVAEREVVPDGGVEMVVVELAGLLRPGIVVAHDGQSSIELLVVPFMPSGPLSPCGRGEDPTSPFRALTAAASVPSSR